MQDLILEYYRIISSISGFFSAPIRDLADAINLPIVSVLLFGILGSTAPCQLSTNVAALAFVSRNVEHRKSLYIQTLAYLAGRLSVYILIGGVVVGLGLQLSQINETAVPVVVAARRAFGPLLVIVGLFMAGIISLRFSVGDKLSTWLYSKIGQRKGLIPAYLLGIAFSFTFCPTLFWLFFGLTIPLAIASPLGIVFPGVFAVGTGLPLLAIAVLGFYAFPVRQFVKHAAVTSKWLQRIAGIIFILVGLNEIALYWFMA